MTDPTNAGSAPIPDNEEQRIVVLRHYNVLDTAEDIAFDNVAKLAAVICEVPIALVSFVDDHRQWLKARVGMNVSETPRDMAFCAHAILQPDLMIVPDALSDERFAKNPLVLSDPHIRFYAGAPLEVEPGIRLGTLCVIGNEPRDLLPSQAFALEVLRDHVVALLHLQVATRKLQDSEARYRKLAQEAGLA